MDYFIALEKYIIGQIVKTSYTHFCDKYHEMYGIEFENGYKYVVGYNFDPQSEFIISPNNKIIAETESFNK